MKLYLRLGIMGLAVSLFVTGCGRFDTQSTFERRCRRFAEFSETSTQAYPCSCAYQTEQGIVYEPVSKWRVSTCKNLAFDFHGCVCGSDAILPGGR